MKRSAAQYAVLSPLLDEALGLDDAARALWLARLPEALADSRQPLGRILAMSGDGPRSRLRQLELRLRSCRRGMAVLVLAEFERRAHTDANEKKR
jgi:hypothetical protein